MDDFLKNQIINSIKYIPINIVKSFFIAKSSDETKALRKKGFVRGVCHAPENYKQLHEANISWVRLDIPYPFITATDIMKYLGDGRVFSDMEQGKADEILMIPVREIMTAADIKTVTSSTSVADAAKLMLEYGVGVFPVLDGDELSGIVTEFDLVKALAE